MREPSSGEDSGEQLTLTVDEKGRVMLPKEVRDRLGIELNDEIHAKVVGSVLQINPKPSTKLETATADRESWEGTTPADIGDSLFSTMDQPRFR